MNNLIETFFKANGFRKVSSWFGGEVSATGKMGGFARASYSCGTLECCIYDSGCNLLSSETIEV